MKANPGDGTRRVLEPNEGDGLRDMVHDVVFQAKGLESRLGLRAQG